MRIFSKLAALGINAQLAASVSVLVLVVETIVVLPSIVVHFNNALQAEVGRQLVLHQLADHHDSTADLGANSNPYITIHQVKNLAALPAGDLLLKEFLVRQHGFSYRDTTPAKPTSWQVVGEVVGSITGMRDEGHVRHFRVSDVMQHRHPSHANQQVALTVPPEYMRGALLDHAMQRALLVLGIVVLVGAAFFFLVQCRVIRPLHKLFDRIFQTATYPFATPNDKHHYFVEDTKAALARLDQQSAYQLAQREKLANLGEAVAKINHDMRNVLSAAVLVSDSLTDSKDPVVVRVAPRVTGAIDRAVHLCQQMLTYLNTPQQLNLRRVAMDGFLDEIRRALALVIDYHGPKQLCVDGEQMFRLVFNLVDNAQKAGATKIGMRVKTNGGGLAIDIADNGPGMDAATKKQLFKPFQAKGGSTGLGLSIARDIAFAHGGDLKLVKTSVRGSVFRLTLPKHLLVAAKPARQPHKNRAWGWRGLVAPGYKSGFAIKDRLPQK